MFKSAKEKAVKPVCIFDYARISCVLLTPPHCLFVMVSQCVCVRAREGVNYVFVFIVYTTF